MAEKISVFLFFLCVILSQGIVGVFSEDVGESNSFIRRKRVINTELGGDVPLVNGYAPYVVNIREAPNNYSICVGTILSKRTIITSAPCVARATHTDLKVVTSSAFKSHGIVHRVIDRKVHLGNHPQRAGDGVALLIVESVIQFNVNTDQLPLHEGPLLPETRGTVFGWGCNPTKPRGTQYVNKLRAIVVPIMHQRDCLRMYQDNFVISDKDICTYHPNRRCGHIDGGAPLVVNNTLAGVYLWTPPLFNQPTPDIFLDTQHLAYGPWIRNNIVH